MWSCGCRRCICSCGCGSFCGSCGGCGGCGGSGGNGGTGGGGSSLPLSSFPIYVSYPAFFREAAAIGGANTAIFTADSNEPACWPWG